MRGTELIDEAVDNGILPKLNTVKCEMCGQDKGIRVYHTEDYSEENIIQSVVCLCYNCHRYVHSNKNTEEMKKYKRDIDNGKIYPPAYKWYWTVEDDNSPNNPYDKLRKKQLKKKQMEKEQKSLGDYFEI